MNKLLLSCCAVALAATPGLAEAKKRKPPPPAPVVVRVAPSDPVELYYFNTRDAPVWTRNAATLAAARRMSAVLVRAPIDGFFAGPGLAAQVDAAVASASTAGSPPARAADAVISKAWVAYIQHLRTPPKGLVYGYPTMAPNLRVDQIMLMTASATDLAAQVDRMADVNPTYRALREAALASGMTIADPALLSNLERARVLPATGKFVIVDIATANLTMYDGGQPVDRMKVVVGTPATQTPMIASIIHWVTLNPYWDVPPNLVQKTIAPGAVKGGAAYLTRGGYEVMSDWTNQATVLPASSVDWKAIVANPGALRVRQRPGPLNSTGRLKVPFPSGQDIFLHDTPAKEKFLLADRHLSNGCIRLEDAKRFARWLLGAEPAMSGKDAEQFVQVPRGVPIFLTYLTATAGPDGKLAMGKDSYGWDGRPDLQLAAATMYQSVARPAP